MTIALISLAADAALADAPAQVVRLPLADLHTPGGQREVIVSRGDNLWKIAAEDLTEAMPMMPRPGEVTTHWRRIIEINRDRLRSGDPDLIYPGEVIRLPEVSERR